MASSEPPPARRCLPAVGRQGPVEKGAANCRQQEARCRRRWPGACAWNIPLRPGTAYTAQDLSRTIPDGLYSVCLTVKVLGSPFSNGDPRGGGVTQILGGRHRSVCVCACALHARTRARGTLARAYDAHVLTRACMGRVDVHGCYSVRHTGSGRRCCDCRFHHRRRGNGAAYRLGVQPAVRVVRRRFGEGPRAPAAKHLVWAGNRRSEAGG